jgi:hypothetical protein
MAGRRRTRLRQSRGAAAKVTAEATLTVNLTSIR